MEVRDLQLTPTCPRAGGGGTSENLTGLAEWGSGSFGEGEGDRGEEVLQD